jgi:hypothetical protein
MLRKQNLLFIAQVLIGISFLWILSCTGKNEKANKPPEGMVALDLGKFGKPFVLFVPDTTRAKLNITEQSSGALEVVVGNGFAMSINEQQADLGLLKKDLNDDEVNKLKSFIKDEPNAILWESEVVQPEYHFMVNQKIGNNDYSFEEIKSTDMDAFSKMQVETMFESAKNIVPLEK